MQRRQYNSGGNRRSFSPGRPRFNSNSSRKTNNIHPSKFINKAVEPKDETPYDSTHDFNSFGLNRHTVANLEYIGYVTPSEIQDKTIPAALEGRDIIGR